MMTQTMALWSTLKGKAGLILGSALALLAPIQFVLLLVGAFIAADTVFGMYTAKKLGKKLTSRKFSKFISKMLVYQSVVILVYALDVLLLGEFFLMIVSVPLVLTKIASIALIAVEIFSIDEKMKMLKPGKGIWFHFKRLLSIAKLVKKEAKDIKE